MIILANVSHFSIFFFCVCLKVFKILIEIELFVWTLFRNIFFKLDPYLHDLFSQLNFNCFAAIVSRLKCENELMIFPIAATTLYTNSEKNALCAAAQLSACALPPEKKTHTKHRIFMAYRLHPIFYISILLSYGFSVNKQSRALNQHT